MTHQTGPGPRRARGVSLIEALIALLVTSLGLLAFAATQARLRVHSDQSKQRSEAMRIAQENMENLRAFGTLAADGTVGNNLAYNTGVVNNAGPKAVLASQVSTATNTSYTVSTSVTESTQPAMKDLRIAVTWTDRNNESHNVSLRSVIAGNDPRFAAALAIPPNGSPVKDPLGRDLRVPIPAKDLGNGSSVFKPDAGGTLGFVFNNNTGLVTARCTVPANVTTAQITASGLAGYTCSTVSGMLLSGYVRFKYGNNPSASDANDATKPLSIRLDLDDTAPPSGAVGTAAQLTANYWPTAGQPVDHGGYSAPECGTQDSKTVRFSTPVSFSQQNNGTTQNVSSTIVTAIVPVATPVTAAGIAPHANLQPSAVLSPSDTGERYIAYTCVVYPRSFGTTLAWTGRSLVVPSGWAVGSNSNTFKVCRYSEDYNLNGLVWTTSGSNVTRIDNTEHPYAYLQATIGLNNQNFLVIDGNRACPTDGPVEVDGQGGENYTNETTVVHQSG